MASQITLGVAPLGGGALQPLLTESIWLGGSRFLVVYAQATPNMLNAQIIDISLDPYASGTPTQVSTTNQNLVNLLPQDRPMLVRLDINRVLMFWSAINKADNYTTTNVLALTKAFDAWVLEIDSSNNINIKVQAANVVPAAFINYTTANYQPSAARSYNVAVNGSTIGGGLCNGPGVTTFLPLSADGAAVNRVLCAARNMVSGGSGNTTNTATLFDLTYTVATATLAITQRYAMNFTFFTSQGGSNAYVGPDDFAWVYSIPGTQKVVFGAGFYDPSGGAANTQIDAYRTYTTPSAFQNNNTVYTFDVTQSPTTWTATNAILTARRAAVMAPLDSDRMLEVTSQVCTTGATNYARVYSLSAGTFTGDIVTDAGNALVNKNGLSAFGLINQVTPLGNDHVMMSVTTRIAAGYTGAGTSGSAYYGIYRLLGSAVLSATASFGVPLLAPITFQRAQDGIIQRLAGQDPNGTSPNVAYDFYGRTSTLTYIFLRYNNPF